tara:strand:- start:22 stop:180 length:159 start_codon:yes stop_codon:yes gene_type:complete
MADKKKSSKKKIVGYEIETEWQTIYRKADLINEEEIKSRKARGHKVKEIYDV